ncbi:MAG: trypsin-like serine protease [Chloroflexi bacterium]|nr:trypsin-like serine protease [Chloroflexota bacterium]
MRTRIAALAATLILLLTVSPAAAVTQGGVPDDGEHTMVGQLLFFVPDVPSAVYPDEPGGWFSCSGTLLSGTVVVTAGHCTFAIGLDGASTTTDDDRFTAEAGNGSGGNDVWFTLNEDDDHFDGFPATFDAAGNLAFPTQEARYEARRDWLNGNALWVRATSFPHPEYDDRAFFIHDAGVIVLDDAQPGPYAMVAGEDYLQKYARARNEHRFEVVGYGLEKVLPFADFGGDTRMKAEPRLLNLVSNPKDTYIQLSNNPRTGGTCFGDSGGPTFDTTNSLLVVAVTSFGYSPNCTGVGGAYRLDQADDLAFLADFGIAP